MTSASSHVLCITGMHRSATSLAASWLQSCGLAVDDGSSLGPRVGNPKGHFEDEQFLKLHHAAIEREMPKSGGWMAKPSRPFRPGPNFEAAARQLIAERTRKFPLWGWKDPRTSLFLEQWKRWIPELKALLIWRPCQEVVESLLDRARRDGHYDVPTIGAVASWCAYNKAILKFKRRWPDDAIMISAGALVSRDREVMELIQSRICRALQYQPLGELFDPALLVSRPGSAFTRFVCQIYGTRTLERELQDASDLMAAPAPQPQMDETVRV